MKSNGRRILYLCTDRGIPFGGTKGAAIHIREFVEALIKLGYDPIVATARIDKDSLYKPDYPVIELPETQSVPFLEDGSDPDPDKQTIKEARDYYRNEVIEETLAAIYREYSFDIVYERYSIFGTAGRGFSYAKKIPFVLEVNAPLVLEASRYRKLNQLALARSVEKFQFLKADHIFAVSGQLSEYILDVEPSAKVTVIPNGVTLENFNISPDEVNWRKRLTNDPEKDFVVGFVGSVKPWHGVDIFLEAMKRLLRNDANFSACIVGNGDKEYEESLTQLRSKLKLNDKVTFTGAVQFEQVPQVMNATDVLVAPYPDLTNFYFSPLKLFEYMAAGKPIVASSIGQIPELLEDEKTALLVPPGDVNALATALKRLKKDAGLRKSIGDNAAEEVRNKHTWQQRAEQVSDIMQGLVNEKKHGKQDIANKI